MHLADAFIQSDLQCYTFVLSLCVFPGNWTELLPLSHRNTKEYYYLISTSTFSLDTYWLNTSTYVLDTSTYSLYTSTYYLDTSTYFNSD